MILINTVVQMNKTTLITLGAIFLGLISVALADNPVARKDKAPRPGKTPAGTVKALYNAGFFDQRHQIDHLALKQLSACLSIEQVLALNPLEKLVCNVMNIH